MKSKFQVRLAFWKGHIAGLSKSGLSRRAYCQQNGLSISTFDYWRAELTTPATITEQRSESNKRWVTLQVADAPVRENGVRLRIGRVTIEVDPGFNRELLAEVIKIAGSAC